MLRRLISYLVDTYAARLLLAGLLLAGVLLLPGAVTGEAEVPPHLGYGMMLAYPPDHLRLVREAGFDWFKYFVYWEQVDGNRDRTYDWDTVNWRLDEACTHELNLLLRVERDPSDWTPIQEHEMDAWETFFADLAGHIAQRRAACPFPYRVALEIWNEPNLDFQWGHQPVDPARYTDMVRRAYRGAKAADPHSLIVAGSLAPTGGLPDGRAMDDVAFLEAMYAAGLKGHFDAISIHNYGFGGPPEDKDWGWGILNFRRAEDIYAVMIAHGDGILPVWATEFGWLLTSTACTPYWEESGFAWQQVTAEQQADYLRRAFAYADDQWPWMGPMIVSNLDFSTIPWYADCDPLRYFAIFNQDMSPRLAYTALTAMDKRPRAWTIWGMQTSVQDLVWIQAIDATHVVSHTVTVFNSGEMPFSWNVDIKFAALPVSVTPNHGPAGDSFTVTVDPRQLPLGDHTAALSIVADAPDVPESPITLALRVRIVADMHTTYLPLIGQP